LIDKAGVDKVVLHIDDALNKGAKLVLGGKPSDCGSNFFHPTILTDVNQDMRLNHEETFGPVAPIIKFKTESEAIELANNTIFGLASYFYANDLSRVIRVQEALETGIVGVNTGIISVESAPFGGVKQSGLGREGSRHGIDEFMEMKYICTSFKADE